MRKKMKRWKAEVYMEEDIEGFEDFELLTLVDLYEAFKIAKRGIEAGWQGFRVVNIDIYEDKEDDDD